MNRSPVSPPKLAAWLLCRCAALRRHAEVQDDLDDLFQQRCQEQGVGYARWRYRLDVLSICLRPSLYRRRSPYLYETARGPIMLTNYVKVALRHLKRQKGYAFINVMGLAVGLACCLLIALYVQDELRYDRFHTHADRIVRAVLDLGNPGGTRALTTTPVAFAPAVQQEFAEVEQGVRMFRPTSTNVVYADRQFQESDFFFADSSFFDMFSFPLRQGRPETVLDAPFTIVLTESTARKYFGEADPVGQVLTVNDTLSFQVTGVAQDVSDQSHIQFDFVASMSSWEAMVPSLANTWSPHMYYTYLQLAPGASAAALEARLPGLIDRSVDLSEGWSFTFLLQPLTDIHFHSHRENELTPNARIEQVYLFGAIALFILLIACINFMNLATARSARRTREVGMRKVLGARRRQLVEQFLGEALLLSGLATILAVLLTGAALPAFNALADKHLTLGLLIHPLFLFSLLGLMLLVGLLAGSYPAFFLSGFRALAVLKGLTQAGGRQASHLLRKGLVVFQFAISVVLLVGTGVVFNQLRFMQTHNLGFEPEQVLVLSGLNGRQLQQAETFKRDVLGYAPVREAALSSTVPGRGAISLSIQGEGMATDEWEVMNTLFVDPDFAETYDVDLVAGRDLSAEHATDSTTAFLLNEAAAAKLGWTPDEAIGKRFALRRGGGRIVGVVKDFHYTSLQTAIEPLALVGTPIAYGSAPLYLSLRLNTGDPGSNPGQALAGTLARLEARWHEHVPNRTFDYFFLDEDFDRQYRAEQRLGKLFSSFAALAIFIACLGLFGLAAFTTEQRTKEIGIRKVLGASIPGLIALLSKDFLKLVAVAAVVAVPVAYLAMSRWLESFAYRIDLSWPVFLLAGLTALLIAFLTVSYQSIKAALADPVTSLRYE